MRNIYGYDDSFTPSEVIAKLREISIEAEENSSNANYLETKEKRIELANRQLAAALKLSTGFVKF